MKGYRFGLQSGVRSLRSSIRLRSRLRGLWWYVSPPQPRPVILMYHRIASELADPWRLCVTPEHLAQQLEVLRRTRLPLSLPEFTSRLQQGSLPPEAVAVTFDDGYVDNLDEGQPLLAVADVPATIFMATGYLDRPGQVWSDELARLILTGHSPDCIEVMAGDARIRLDLGGSVPPRLRWRPDGAMETRRAALVALWAPLREMTVEAREPIIAGLRRQIALPGSSAPPGRIMTRPEALRLDSRLVTIGAHTVSHPFMPSLTAEACYREARESKEACEALTGSEVSLFAYPYGGFDEKVSRAVREAGFSFACSVKSGPVTAQSDPLALPRLHVENVDGDRFEQALHRVSAQ